MFEWVPILNEYQNEINIFLWLNLMLFKLINNNTRTTLVNSTIVYFIFRYFTKFSYNLCQSQGRSDFKFQINCHQLCQRVVFPRSYCCVTLWDIWWIFYGEWWNIQIYLFKTFSIVFKVDFYFYSFSKGQCNAASVLIDVLLFQSSNLHLLKLTRLLRLARLIQKMDR